MIATLTLISGEQLKISGSGATKVQLALLGTGARAFEVEVDGARRIFLNSDSVAYVEIIDDVPEHDAVSAAKG